MKLKAYKGKTTVDLDTIQSTTLREKLDDVHAIAKGELFDNICLFVFLLCDLSNDNPLVDRPFTLKREEAIGIVFGSNPEEFKNTVADTQGLRDAINASIDAYARHENTDEQKDINTYNTKMDQFRSMLHGMTPTICRNESERSGAITFSTNIEIINSVLHDIVGLIQAKASMISLHTNGTVPKHLRGGLSPLSKGQVNTILPDVEQIDLQEYD